MTDPGQRQFKLGLTAYCQDEMPSIRVVSMVKRASACYTKGEWDRATNEVVPFHADGLIESDLPVMEHAGTVKERIDGANLAKLVAYIRQHPSAFESTRLRAFREYVLQLEAQARRDGRGTYLAVEYTQRRFGGRRVARGAKARRSVSVQGMQHDLRAWLLGCWCRDLDIVNCIPTILLQMARRDAVPEEFCAALSHYVAHREAVLATIMEQTGCSRPAAKNAVIQTYNGGSLQGWPHRGAFLESLGEEVKAMREYMLALPRHATVRAKCLKETREASDRSAFAHLAFMEEDRILQEMEASLRRGGWKSNGLIFDGLPVFDRPDHSIVDAMRQAESDVEATTGYRIRLAEKEMYALHQMSVEELLRRVEAG